MFGTKLDMSGFQAKETTAHKEFEGEEDKRHESIKVVKRDSIEMQISEDHEQKKLMPNASTTNT